MVNQPVDISIKFPENATVKESTKLKLNCLLSRRSLANVLTKVKILKDGQPISLNSKETPSRYELVDNGDRQLSFIIEKSQLGDSGKYTLVLNESTSTSCNVKVVPDDSSESKPAKAGPPRIIEDLNPNEPIEGLTTEPFKIGLKVEGDDLKVEWYHDGKKVLPLTNQIESKKVNEPNIYNLVFNFEKPFTSDSGKYYCVISNPHGMVKSKEANVQVKGILIIFYKQKALIFNYLI